MTQSLAAAQGGLRLAQLARLCALLCLAIGITVALPASGANVRVLCPTALRAPVLELSRMFVRSSERKLEFIFASVGAIHKRVATGERADIVIGTARGIHALVLLGRAVEGSEAMIARTVLALATQRAMPAPSIATATALTQTLRAARALALPDASLGASGGAQVAELIERLGIAAEVRAKAGLVADSREVVRRIAEGTADIGIARMSDIVGAQNVVVTGPLIYPSTASVIYAVALVRRTASADTARAFIEHLTSAEAEAVFRAAGFAAAD